MGDRLWPLLAAFGLVIAGVGMLSTGATLALQAHGLDSADVGLVQSLYYVGAALGCVFGQRLLAPSTLRRVFVASSVLGGACALLPLADPGRAGWGAIRFLHGVCVAGLYCSVEMALHLQAPSRLRGRVFAAYQVLTYLAMAAGQWALGALRADAARTFPAAALLFVAGAGVARMFFHAAPRAADVRLAAPSASLSTRRGDFRRVAAKAPFGLLVAGCSGLLLSSFYTVFPLVAQEILRDVGSTGRYLAAVMVLAVLPLVVSARHADLRGRAATAAWIAALMLAGLVALAIASTPAWLWSCGLLYSTLVFCVYGLGASDTNDRVSDQERGVAASALMLVFSVGGCLGPVLLGSAMAAWGRPGYFLACAAVVAPVGAAALLARRRRARWPAKRAESVFPA